MRNAWRLLATFSLLLLTMVGCESQSKESLIALTDVATPAEKVNWKDVVAQAPVKGPDLTLWLKADSGVQLKSGTFEIEAWTDRSGNGMVFAPLRTSSSGPVLQKKHSVSMLHFDGKNQELASNAILGSKLLGDQAATLAIVVHQDPSSPNNDTIGWGGCGDNRFNTHFTVNGSLVFQMGNPNKDQIAPNAPEDWSKNLHVVTVIRQGAEIRLSVDGRPVKNARGFVGILKTNRSMPVVIGGICANGFKGEISEVLIFNTAISEKKEKGIVKYLADKYGVSLM